MKYMYSNELFLIYIYISSNFRAQNLRQDIVVKTSFRTRVLRMRLGSFVDINILVMKYFLIFLNQNLQNVKTP